MKNIFCYILFALAGTTAAMGQTARVEGRIVEKISGMSTYASSAMLICDALDSALTVELDTSGHFVATLPTGRCMLCVPYFPSVLLDIVADTVIDPIELEYAYYYYDTDRWESRHRKDSVLRAHEAMLKADLHYYDTTWPEWVEREYNYHRLAYLYDHDMHYPLPQWRTFSRDTALHYLRYCHRQNPERYDYLYYPIRQLEHLLGLPADPAIRPPKAPDERIFVPMPGPTADWLTDTITSYMSLFESARYRSEIYRSDFAPLGEKSLVYPRRKKTAVRMLVYGGMGNTTAMRIEDGRFHYVTCDRPWAMDTASPSEFIRWSVKLTRAERDTLARCLDTLRKGGDQYNLDNSMAIDAPNIEIELADPDGYRCYLCNNPDKHPLTIPFDRFLDSLWMRYTRPLSIAAIVDATTHEILHFTTVIVTGKDIRTEWRHYSGRDRFRLPEGKYTVRIEHEGFVPQEYTVRLRDSLRLDTVRLEHRSIDLHVDIEQPGGGMIEGPLLLYVNGVDTAICEKEPAPRISPDVYHATFRRVPAGNWCFLVEDRSRVGGHYHSNLLRIGDSLDHPDEITMTLDHSRRPFRSKHEKDSALRTEVQFMKYSEGYTDYDVGREYYYDHLLRVIPSWYTFDSACTEARRYLTRAYRSRPDLHYLYYPIRQMEFLDDSHDRPYDTTIQPPLPDSNAYIPLPIHEHMHYSFDDILTRLEETDHLSGRYADFLKPMDEPTLLTPRRQGPVLRVLSFDSHFTEQYSLRIENDTLYDKKLYNLGDLQDPFDTTLRDSTFADTLVVRQRPLTDIEKDSLRLLLRALDEEHYTGTVGYPITFHSIFYRIEYILDGNFHYFTAFKTHSDDPIDRLKQWLRTLSS